MVISILEADDYAAAVFDSLSSHICVLDKAGMIVAANPAWQNFAFANPPHSNSTGLGAYYLDICRSSSGAGSEGAATFASGVQSVLDGEIETFQMEYPCHSSTESRWFVADVTLLKSRLRGVVIAHTSITDQKLLEFELLRSATTDALTGLPNRRYFLERANLEIERVRRFGATLSVVMIDLDDFKMVNDTYGHAAGDEALRCFASLCKRVLRKIDLFARIGGEEFVVMLPGTNEAGALNIAEKLRKAVCDTAVESTQLNFNITASFGVAEGSSRDAIIDDCLGRADIALYAAKRAGRNCVLGFASIPLEARKPRA